MAKSSWDQLSPNDKLDWLKARQDRFDLDLNIAFDGLRSLQGTLRRLAGIMDCQAASVSELSEIVEELSHEALARQYGGTSEDQPEPQQPKAPHRAESESEKRPRRASG